MTSADPARIAQASLELSVVSQQTGRHEATLALAEEAAAIYRSLADRRGEAEALDQIGLASQRAARSREALAYFHEAKILYGDAADQHGVADTLSHSGIACWQLGRYPETPWVSCVTRFRSTATSATGAARRRPSTIWGGCSCSAVTIGTRSENYQESLRIFTDIGAAQSQAILYHNIGSVYHYKGSYEKGLTSCRRALTIYRDIGDLPDEADVLNDIGAIYQSAALL